MSGMTKLSFWKQEKSDCFIDLKNHFDGKNSRIKFIEMNGWGQIDTLRVVFDVYGFRVSGWFILDKKILQVEHISIDEDVATAEDFGGLLSVLTGTYTAKAVWNDNGLYSLERIEIADGESKHTEF